ncbi:DNA helicase II / ATP-dependent DNA helicase PcrA [Gammaproteobacteria bacterium]
MGKSIMNTLHDSLNENQRRAVKWSNGALLVLAGPGSGKTLVLTLRAARILKEDADASVLALTFTTKAADEMRERLDNLMGGRADRAHLCTFHSFAGDILRQHGSHIGVQPDFSLLTLDEDRIALLEEAIHILSGDLSSIPGERRNRLSSIKISPCDISSIPDDRRNLLVLLDRLFAESYNGEQNAAGMPHTPPWIPVLFDIYCKTLQVHNRLDYGALLHFARKLLSENAGVARLTRLAWQFVCVDEFQDTNRAQYNLMRLISQGERPNLFVVADDDQIIYQWNGASPERLLALTRDYKMEVIQLPENFRCPPIIITFANNLIVHNQTRSPGKESLIARKTADNSNALKAQFFRDEDVEVAGISSIITKRGWSPSDCVVLARSTKLLERAANALSNDGIIPYFAKRKNQFESASVKWLFSTLRLANARHDRELLRRVCVAWQSFTEEIVRVEDVEAAAALNGGDFLRAWLDAAATTETGGIIGSLLERTRKELGERLIFMEFLEWFWTRKWMDDPMEVEEIKTWQELHGALLREHGPENVTLHLYLQEMDLKSKAAFRVPGSLPCLTVHGAKGLEFRHVFLIGMAEEVFPSYQAVKKGANSREMEEERRSCFVAITRVQETLHVSWAGTYNGYLKKPSRFLTEMGFGINVT